MAAFAHLTLRSISRPSLLRGFMSTSNGNRTVIKRTISNYPSSVYLEKPQIDRLGAVKALVIAVTFTYFGALLSKKGAAFLEENDIFVPEDDD